MQTTPIRTYNSPRLVARHAGIREAARAQLAEKGFNGVTMEQLAKQAGVTKKTLYNVYGSKDELLVAAISEVVESYRPTDSDTEPGIPAIMASRQLAIARVIEAPAYANAMTAALMQAETSDILTEMLISNAITFTTQHLAIEKNSGGLLDAMEPVLLAEQLTSQAWGQIFMLYNGITSIEKIEFDSLTGMLMLLASATRGARHAWVLEQLEQVNKTN